MHEQLLDSSQAPPAKRIKTDDEITDTTAITELNEGSGVPIRPETFYDCGNMSDKKLAGYLGFSSTSELHVCTISWPILCAVASIVPIAHKLNKELVLGPIRDCLRTGGSAVKDKKWSLLDSEGRGATNAQKAEHLAIVLINLESDLNIIIAATNENNQLQHELACQKFSRVYPSHICPPQISYPIKPPLLTPLEGEDFLEPDNRYLSLLRHMRNLLISFDYDKRYKNHKFKSGHPVDENQKPVWMRLQSLSQHPVTQQDFITQKHVSQAAIVTDLKLVESYPRYPPPSVGKSFAIVCDHTIEPGSLKPGLKCAMDRAKADGIHLPSELQKLKKDPRQMHEESLLYRQIREQFECRALGIDMGKLLLQYNSSALGESMLIT
ncbi:hypothetical protein D6D19_08971 [Aureobasidium pullulans]|uniref:Uncharacterized protein n=1 Tax=Aureobasidium pullulans TaxID=5580 RepID=A0A4S8ZQF4_AURPU|nr:hypothetical protein D6D19_08971 [Aureobasidium pullulans]